MLSPSGPQLKCRALILPGARRARYPREGALSPAWRVAPRLSATRGNRVMSIACVLAREIREITVVFLRPPRGLEAPLRGSRRPCSAEWPSPSGRADSLSALLLEEGAIKGALRQYKKNVTNAGKISPACDPGPGIMPPGGLSSAVASGLSIFVVLLSLLPGEMASLRQGRGSRRPL